MKQKLPQQVRLVVQIAPQKVPLTLKPVKLMLVWVQIVLNQQLTQPNCLPLLRRIVQPLPLYLQRKHLIVPPQQHKQKMMLLQLLVWQHDRLLMLNLLPQQRKFLKIRLNYLNRIPLQVKLMLQAALLQQKQQKHWQSSMPQQHLPLLIMQLRQKLLLNHLLKQLLPVQIPQQRRLLKQALVRLTLLNQLLQLLKKQLLLLIRLLMLPPAQQVLL